MTDFSKERYKICENCEQLNILKVCNICKCFMPIKTKLPNKQCPLNKWQKIEQVQRKDK